MLRHSILLLYRNLKQFKSVFFINLIGLSTGLACIILIYFWVKDELNIDRFHEKTDRLYQVMGNESVEGTINTSDDTYDFLSTVLKAEMPEVAYAAVTTPKDFFPAFSLYAGKDHVKGTGKFAEPDFFNIFSYPLIAGNIESVFSQDENAVISTTLATRLFGTATNVVGKTFQWQIMDLKQEVIVSGIFNDVTVNASEHFDFILPFDAFRKIMNTSPTDYNWGNRTPFLTYIVVHENIDISRLQEKMKNLIQSKLGKPSPHSLFLTPYGDTYLYSRYENGMVAGGRIEYVRLFVIIAVAILLVACINFINLFTAKASRRIREVGIKKAIGAQRKTLIQQYLTESVMMSMISMLIAFALAELILPQFNEITGKQLSLTFDPQSTISLISISMLTGLLAGTYPALYISGFQPAKILRGQLTNSAGEFWVRKGLVVFQFTLSVTFIVGVLVIHNQIEFVQSRNLGYDKNNVLFFESEGKVAETASTFIAEVKKLPGIVNASSMLGNIVGESGGTPGRLRWNDRDIVMRGAAINYELLETLGIQMKSGRTFSKDFPADINKVIYNEKAIDALGITDPVGKIVDGQEILGVVEDFHFQSLHEVIKPFCFRLGPDLASTIMIRIKTGMETETIAALERFYKVYNPGYTFNYKFLDQAHQAQYESEKRVSVLSRYFAGLAIIISCLGLFGLAAFTAERRSKEIGIRKILGLSDLGVVWLMSLDFTKMVLLSILIGLPLSFVIISAWLENFAYKIEISWWYFVLAGALTLFITWLTVGTQTIKASRANPVKSLRSE
jgi:ABC-type antimicrobial peptide transport system permease subunit